MARSNADEVYRFLQEQNQDSGFGVTPYTPIPRARQDPSGLQRTLGGAARLVGGAFEPLLLPQDALFGLLAGARDQNKSPLDYWRETEWAAYAPWGATPERAATGADLLGLYGVENEATQKWGGIALDLVADPLLVGSWMSGMGRAAKLATGGGIGDDLINLGRKIDDSMGLLPVTRGGKTRSLAHSILPTTIREGMEERFFQFGQAVFNNEIPVLGSTIRGLTPRGTALKMRFGKEAGQRLRRQESMAEQLGGEVREAVVDSFQRVNDLLGNDTGNWFGNVFEAIGLRAKAGRNVTKFRSGTQEAILKQAQGISDNHSALIFGVTPFQDAQNMAVREFSRAVSPFEEAITASQRTAAKVDVDEAVQTIRKAATRNGDNADVAESAFRDTVRIVSESDALLGYHLSMYGPIQRKFMEATANKLGYKAVDVWNDVVARGMQGEDINRITEFSIRKPSTYRSSTGRRYLTDSMARETVSVQDVFGVNTLGEFLESDEFFSRLDFGKYANALGQGHMRRSYAAMMDPGGFERYFDSLESKRLLPSNVIDEIDVEAALSEKGLPQAGRLVREYFEGITPGQMAGAGKRASARGTITSTEQLSRHLLENGVNKRDAQAALDALSGAINGSPAYGQFIERARKAISKFRSIDPDSAAGLGGNAFVKQRKTLEEDYLEILGEMANPMLSLDESSRFARTTLPTSKWMSALYDFANRNGLVSDTYVPGLKPLAFKNDGILGGFAGKYVSPYIEKELKRSLIKSQYRTPQWLERISQFVRGSLLSGPNILTANLGGGVYTSSLLGVNPLVMTQEMGGVLRDMARAARDPDFVFEDYRLLRELIPLDLSRMSDAAFVERGANRLIRQARGESAQGAKQTLDAVGDLLRTFIDNPAEILVGAKGNRTVRQAGAALGLQGFATSESLMKISAFRAAKKQGFNIDEAAEIARLSTFDYSELPDALRMLRDAGLLMFPGFSYFIMGRTLTGALRRPGAMAVANRVPEALMNAQDITEEQRAAIYASMPEWLKDDIGVPIRTRTGGQGENIYSVVPLNQFLPTNVISTDPRKALGPFADSLATLGIYQPFFELMYATITGSGEAPFSKRYGQQVFQPGRTGLEAAGQAAGFLYSNLAPTGLRKVAGYTPGQGATGIAPSILDSLVELPQPLAQLGYDMNTIRQGRVMRDTIDNIISGTFRSAQPIAVGGRFPTAARTFNQAMYEHNAKVQTLQEDLRLARVRGDAAAVQDLVRRITKMNEEFSEKWRPLLSAVREGQGNR